MALVQHKSGTSTTSNVCNVTLAATGAGNALVVVVSKNSTGDLNLSGITLGGSGTGWASRAYQVGTDAYDLGFWANFAIAGGQTALVVTAASGDSDLMVDVYEVSGGLTGLDQVVFHEVDLTAATWTSTATLTTAQASEFILGAVNGYNNTGGAFTFTGPASPWANEAQLTPAGNSSQLSGYQISSATGTFTYSGTASTTGTNLVYLAAVATFKSVVVVPGTAALSGSGTLTGAGVFRGAAPMSGSGTLTGTGTSTGFGGGATLSGSGALSGTVTGTFEYAAVMSGSGTLGTAPSVTVLFTGGISTYAATYAATYPGAAPVFSGTGTLSLSGVVLKFPAALSGSGTLSVLQVTGGLVFASPGAATPQAYPLSSQVAVAAPGSSNWQYLGTVGVVTALTYSFTCPGGADQMTATVMVPATYRTQLFNPGWQVRVTRGGHVVWTGKMDEPVPTSSGWNLTASGDGNRGTDYLAIYTSTWPAGQPDQSVNDAIFRGLPWVNPGIGTPAGAWFGQAVDTGAQTITALLTLVCSRGGLTWYVNSQPGGYIGSDLSVFPLPTVPNRLLTSSTPVARTLGGDINTIWIRYEVSADTTVTNSDGTTTSVPAVYALTGVQNGQSVAAHGVLETYIDLSDVGVMTAAAADGIAGYVLQIYQRASFAGPFTVSYGQLTNTGGAPIDPGCDQAGTVCKLILSDFGYGGEVTLSQPITFIVGAYSWDDMAQVATVTPYQALDQSLTGMLSEINTVLTPVQAASS